MLNAQGLKSWANNGHAHYCMPCSRDGGPVAHAVQTRQLLANNAALQARMDGLHLGSFACTALQGGIPCVCGKREKAPTK